MTQRIASCIVLTWRVVTVTVRAGRKVDLPVALVVEESADEGPAGEAAKADREERD